MNGLTQGFSVILAASIGTGAVCMSLALGYYYLKDLTHPDLDAQSDEPDTQEVSVSWREKLTYYFRFPLKSERFLGPVTYRGLYSQGNRLAYWLAYLPLRAEPERIVGVTIRHPDGTIYTSYRGSRHGTVIPYMARYRRDTFNSSRDQGFLTSHGRHVDRREALRIARAAKQLIRKTHPTTLLFSEDLW